MPNGDPDFHEKELPALERFFSTLKPVLTAFATRRNLAIDKYYHQVPAWEFRFRHPSGGEAYLEVRRVDDETVELISAWWQDDYDAATRSTRWANSGELKLSNIDLVRLLHFHLDEVLSWRPGQWTQVDGVYQDVWHRTWTKSAFDALGSHLPTPTP